MEDISKTKDIQHLAVKLFFILIKVLGYATHLNDASNCVEIRIRLKQLGRFWSIWLNYGG